MEIAEPVNVPVSVKLPMVDAAGRKLSASVTLPEPLPTRDAEIVQAVAAGKAPRTLLENVQPLLVPPTTLKLVVLVTGFEPVTD